VTLSYAGSAIAPTNVGNYEVIGTVVEANYTGSVTNQLTVTPAAATVNLTGLAQVYDGTARAVTATTDPADLNVTFSYGGNAAAPTNAGSYQVIGTITELNYVGSTTNTLVVLEPSVVLSIEALTADTVVLSWNSIPGRTYRVQYKNNLADPGWLELLPHVTATETVASLTNVVGNQPQRFYRIRTLELNPSNATVTLLDLMQTYDGTLRVANATTVPAGLNVSVTYDGSAVVPTNAGSYEVVAAVVEGNYVGGITNILVVSPASAEVTLLNLAQTYDGTARAVTATTDPADLNVTFSYAGNAAAPTNAGSYQMIGTITELNYVGSVTNTLIVSPASAGVTLLNLAQTYDGTAREVIAVTDPDDLNVAITYDGGATAPTNAGSYEVIGTISELNYAGSATNTLVVTGLPPIVISLTVASPGEVVVAWNSISNLTYRLQFKNNLADASWTDVIPDITATGAASSVTNSVGIQPQRFYQLYLVP